MSSETALALYNEGRDLLEHGDRAAGIDKLREAALLAPHFKTYEVLGEALLAAGAHQEACIYLAAAAGLGNRQSRSRYLLAKALLALGSDSATDAAVQLTKALECNPEYRSARELLERVLSEHPDVADELQEQTQGGE